MNREEYIKAGVITPAPALSIYECEYRCSDCEEERGGHNSFHLPYTTFEFLFHEEGLEELKDGEMYNSIRRIETYSEEAMEKGLDGLFPSTYSWTQLAIARCNELSR